MAQLREHWEGVSLPGDYLLERWVDGDDDAAFFQTPAAADGRRLVVKLVREFSVGSAGRLAMWQRTQQLRHANLLEMLNCGRAELGGEIALYAVFEPVDDTLASALKQSPLSEGEAREVLGAVVDALGYLHAQGLAPGALDPDHVVAVGDGIKLSTDALRESTGETPDTDALRAFWYKISPCSLARSADILAQALQLVDGASPASTPEPPPAEAAAAVAPAPVSHSAPAENTEARTPSFGITQEMPHRIPKWIPVGAAAVVLLILGLNLRHSPDPLPQRPAPTIAAEPAQPSHVDPEQAKPSPVKPISKVDRAQPKQPPAGKGMWRVIAFTYRSRAGAQKKVSQVNQRHPEFDAKVFSPKEKKGYYLVALGGRMSREDALRLQRKARSQGVARDVYVQNYLD
jgi:hypothetical protein